MSVILGVAREYAPGEKSVALTPETCKKLVAAGARVLIERGLGRHAHFPDQAYPDAGARLVDDAQAAVSDADIVPCVQPPSADAIARMKPGAVLLGILQPQADGARGEASSAGGLIAVPL